MTGDEGIRTLDLRIANATLSQLSYVPGCEINFSRLTAFPQYRRHADRGLLRRQGVSGDFADSSTGGFAGMR